MKELLLSYFYCIKSCIYMYEYVFFLSFHMRKKKNNKYFGKLHIQQNKKNNNNH